MRLEVVFTLVSVSAGGHVVFRVSGVAPQWRGV